MAMIVESDAPFSASCVIAQCRRSWKREPFNPAPSDEVDLHVEDILNQFDANGPAFQKLSRELKGVIGIGGLSQEYLPAVSLEPEIVGRLAQYNLRLDIDR
jgi:hypothetical protein